MSRIGQSIKIESISVVVRARGGGMWKRGMTLVDIGFPFKIMKMFWN